MARRTRIKGLGYERVDDDRWRFVDLDTGKAFGKLYVTDRELRHDIATVAAQLGKNYSPPSTQELDWLFDHWSQDGEPLSARYAAEILSINDSNVRSYRSGSQAMPFPALHLLALKLSQSNIDATGWRTQLDVPESINEALYGESGVNR